MLKLFFLIISGLCINNECSSMRSGSVSSDNESIGESNSSNDRKAPVNWQRVATQAIDAANERADTIAEQEETIQGLESQKEALTTKLQSLSQENDALIKSLRSNPTKEERDGLMQQITTIQDQQDTFKQQYNQLTQKLRLQIKSVNEENKKIARWGRYLKCGGGLIGIGLGVVAAPVTATLGVVVTASALMGSFGAFIGHSVSPSAKEVKVPDEKTQE